MANTSSTPDMVSGPTRKAMSSAMGVPQPTPEAPQSVMTLTGASGFRGLDLDSAWVFATSATGGIV